MGKGRTVSKNQIETEIRHLTQAIGSDGANTIKRLEKQYQKAINALVLLFNLQLISEKELQEANIQIRERYIECRTRIRKQEEDIPAGGQFIFEKTDRVVICERCGRPEYEGKMKEALCRKCYKAEWQARHKRPYPYSDLNGSRPTVIEYKIQEEREEQ